MSGGQYHCSGIKPALAISGILDFLGFKVWPSSSTNNAFFQLQPLTTPDAAPALAGFASS